MEADSLRGIGRGQHNHSYGTIAQLLVLCYLVVGVASLGTWFTIRFVDMKAKF